MPKRAWCSECGGYVVLTPEGLCPAGHARPCLRGIEEVAEPEVPARAEVPAQAAPEEPRAPAAEASALLGCPPAPYAESGAAAASGGSAVPDDLLAAMPAAPPAPSSTQAAAEQPPGIVLDENSLHAAVPVWVVLAVAAILLLVTTIGWFAFRPFGVLMVMFLGTTLIYAGCLWAGMRITGVDGSFLAVTVISAVTAAAGLVPYVGWIGGLVVMFWLLRRWTTAEIWPDAVLMVVVANGLSQFGLIGLHEMLGQSAMAGLNGMLGGSGAGDLNSVVGTGGAGDLNSIVPTGGAGDINSLMQGK